MNPRISITRKLAGAVLLSTFVFSQGALAKSCPSLPDLMASLDHQINGVPLKALRKLFGAKHGHKWNAFKLFAEKGLFAEATDFLGEIRAYELKYASLGNDEKEELAKDICAQYVRSPDTKTLRTDVNIGDVLHRKLAALCDKAGVPSQELFAEAKAELTKMIQACTIP
jgi:hypothetical protein